MYLLKRILQQTQYAHCSCLIATFLMNEGKVHPFPPDLRCAPHPSDALNSVLFSSFRGEAFTLFAPQGLFRLRTARSQTRASTSVWRSTGRGRDIQLQPISTCEVRPPLAVRSSPSGTGGRAWRFPDSRRHFFFSISLSSVFLTDVFTPIAG